ncbi:CGNR zinc finger domain-containing protein [Streptomyces fulvoviolaceus]|uniref:CGNR zinc finger domain-containing protein n=1 Tax=Streptomyces fulvoviolaceus TaxID=285535 RepID=UPI0021BE320F|nr:CGNR zinc finger domain-containing protein [Streptomyces fulvoviolaceus]MCT9078521.1 CGNR zinc finger domain-containing protein [Streptomyces fulvoviolaceus]
MPSVTPDPRPLIGEPLALDLLNTRWMEEGRIRDLLADLGGLAVWLDSTGLSGGYAPDTRLLRHTLQARDALAATVDGSLAEGAPLVDAVLAHGRTRATLTATGPGEIPEFGNPAWGPAWLAARNYLELLATAPDRIRTCAHESCILHFFDTSRNGTRRWCSMATCGNRAKASRHYARSKDA